jgi:formate dehydrogenase major subunit
VPGLGASFGRGAATNYQQDLANSDCLLIMGSNMAEAHPVGFRWPMRAKERGATMIHVDPRFTRTSALADVHVQIRAGSDIAFLGGLVNYVLENEKWFKEYVENYTNASSIIDDAFKDTEDLAGVFSGLGDRAYDAQGGHWAYAKAPGMPDAGGGSDSSSSGHGHEGAAPKMGAPASVPKDPTLKDPRCVMQILRRHFARYTPEMVSKVTGCRPEELVRVAELMCANSGRERTTSIIYALGWTQHSTGVQIIRTAGILQLLLGNMGRPGGGIMAMRGHSTIQGSTDIATLYDVLPGYLPQPTNDDKHQTLDDYCSNEGMPNGYWSNFKKFAVSLLKAWYGDAATKDNDFGYSFLPRIDDDYSQLPYFNRMANGEIKGYFLFGQNPAGGAPNAVLHRAGMRKLDWLVCVDWFEIESAVFWKDDPNAPPPSEIKTEVFFIPAAASPEKEGSLTNTQRLLQWHDIAIDPPDDCRSDAWFLYQLGKKLKELYAGSTLARDQALLALTWDYERAHRHILPDGTPSRVDGEPDLDKVLREVNGCKLGDIDERTGQPRLLSGFGQLADDGSTASGCWIYCGVYPEPDRNRARERKRTGHPLEPEWGYAWPDNRRIMYNRASADPEGKPWSERKKLVWWDEAEKKWVGLDRPDYDPLKPPSYRPPPDAKGMAAIAGNQPFIMKGDGLGWLYAPSKVKDGPLPAHYEPIESPVGNLLYPRQTSSPTVRTFDGPLNQIAYAPSDQYPIIATTFRLTEHYLSGPMSRFNSWLNELQPEMFVELDPELAAERGIEHAGWMTVSTPRGTIEARAMVTRRLRPVQLGDRVVHQIGLPFHWAFAGESVGGNANDLTALLAEPNVSMHEAKAFTCQIAPGRLPIQNRPHPTKAMAPWPTGEEIPDTPESAQPEGRFRRGR